MTFDDFLTKFKDILQTDETILPETSLESLDDWDSMTTMTLSGWLNEIGKPATYSELSKLKTVKEVAEKAGVEF